MSLCRLILAGGLLAACSSDPTSPRADAAPQDLGARDAPPDQTSLVDATLDVADAGDLGAAACGACTTYGEPTDLAAVSVPSIAEASGIAASDRDPGVFFVHNDSGDSARFFAVRAATGALDGEFHLAGVTAVDWEDIAVGPCDTGRCVYLADIGDNTSVRAEYVIHRVAEPAAEVGVHTLTPTSQRFVYPDGAHNAESMLVTSDGEVFVVTKREIGPSGVYRLPRPWRTGERVTLERVAELTPPRGSNLFTGGSAHPCERAFLLRTYNRLYLYRAPAGAPFAQAFGAMPEAMPVATESQGEGVGWNADGRGYVTISEGVAPVVHGVGCR